MTIETQSALRQKPALFRSLKRRLRVPERMATNHDFRHVTQEGVTGHEHPMEPESRHRRRFALVAIPVWLTLGWPGLRDLLRPHDIVMADPGVGWVVAFLAFGLALVAWTRASLARRTAWAMIGVQIAATMLMAATDGSSIFAVLFVLTSWQVASMTAARRAIGCVVLQSAAFLVLWRGWICPEYCLMLAIAFVLSLFAIFTANAVRREAETARRLAGANAELCAAQVLLTETARAAERVRISRELHDAWGHELTALALQLEVASHVVPGGPAGEHVQVAKDMSRALLARVRDIVGELRETDAADLRAALSDMAAIVPRPVIHVDIPADIEQQTAPNAHVLLRCAQEAVTNAIRHADADNLWLELRREHDGVRLRARDDGQGSTLAAEPRSIGPRSNGLAGMRERLEALGGRLAIRSAAGRGFSIDVWVPAASA